LPTRNSSASPRSISFHLPAYRAPLPPGAPRPAAAAPAQPKPDPATKLAVAAVYVCRHPACSKAFASAAGAHRHARKAHPTWLRRLDLQNALLGLDEPVRCCVRRIAPASVLAAALAAQRDELLRPAPAPAAPPPPTAAERAAAEAAAARRREGRLLSQQQRQLQLSQHREQQRQCAARSRANYWGEYCAAQFLRNV